MRSPDVAIHTRGASSSRVDPRTNLGTTNPRFVDFVTPRNVSPLMYSAKHAQGAPRAQRYADTGASPAAGSSQSSPSITSRAALRASTAPSSTAFPVSVRVASRDRSCADPPSTPPPWPSLLKQSTGRVPLSAVTEAHPPSGPIVRLSSDPRTRSQPDETCLFLLLLHKQRTVASPLLTTSPLTA